MLHVAAARLEDEMALRCNNMGPALIAACAAAMALAGCSETMSLAKLPDITRLPSKLLTKEEQSKSLSQMIEKGQTHQAEAAKEIEKAK
jgi:hypothetical protein